MANRLETWAKFHFENPRVFELFIEFARQAKRAGRERFSARTIGERIRWYVDIDTNTADGFKLDNNFLPYYARLAMLLHPAEFAGLFEKRDRKFQGTDGQILESHQVRRNGHAVTDQGREVAEAKEQGQLF